MAEGSIGNMRASNPELFHRSATASGGAVTAPPAGPDSSPPPQPKSCTLTGSGVNWAIYHGNVLSGND